MACWRRIRLPGLQAFNALSHDYSATSNVTSWLTSTTIAPDCFTLMVKDEKNISNPDDIYVIHLPKSGTRTYHYYDYAGTRSEEIRRELMLKMQTSFGAIGVLLASR